MHGDCFVTQCLFSMLFILHIAFNPDLFIIRYAPVTNPGVCTSSKLKRPLDFKEITS